MPTYQVNFDKMEKFLEYQNLQKLTQEEIDKSEENL